MNRQMDKGNYRANVQKPSESWPGYRRSKIRPNRSTNNRDIECLILTIFYGK